MRLRTPYQKIYFICLRIVDFRTAEPMLRPLEDKLEKAAEQ